MSFYTIFYLSFYPSRFLISYSVRYCNQLTSLHSSWYCFYNLIFYYLICFFFFYICMLNKLCFMNVNKDAYMYIDCRNMRYMFVLICFNKCVMYKFYIFYTFYIFDIVCPFSPVINSGFSMKDFQYALCLSSPGDILSFFFFFF